MKIRNLVFGAICGIIFFSCSESGGGKEVEMDRFVTDLMGKMTIREKLGQLNLPSGGDLVTGSVMNSELSDMIRKEEIGGFFNVKGIKKIYDLQRLAVEENRLKIPLIVGADVIHGYETIFPIPLALSCSWDTLAIQRMARISAGVSNCGPGMKKYTPSWTRSAASFASRRASSRRRGVYIRLTSKKRSPNSGRFFPRMGLAPLSFMWSEMTMISPGR